MGAAQPNRQSELARCLMALLKLGETNPTSLANSAIRALHQRHSRDVEKPFGGRTIAQEGGGQSFLNNTVTPDIPELLRRGSVS